MMCTIIYKVDNVIHYVSGHAVRSHISLLFQVAEQPRGVICTIPRLVYSYIIYTRNVTITHSPIMMCKWLEKTKSIYTYTNINRGCPCWPLSHLLAVVTAVWPHRSVLWWSRGCMLWQCSCMFGRCDHCLSEGVGQWPQMLADSKLCILHRQVRNKRDPGEENLGP